MGSSSACGRPVASQRHHESGMGEATPTDGGKRSRRIDGSGVRVRQPPPGNHLAVDVPGIEGTKRGQRCRSRVRRPIVRTARGSAVSGPCCACRGETNAATEWRRAPTPWAQRAMRNINSSVTGAQSRPGRRSSIPSRHLLLRLHEQVRLGWRPQCVRLLDADHHTEHHRSRTAR